jgi:hypothetical protein
MLCGAFPTIIPSIDGEAFAMPSLSNSLLLLGALVPSVYIGWYPFLNTFGGRMGDAKLHHDHMNHGPLNNDKCQVFPGRSTH